MPERVNLLVCDTIEARNREAVHVILGDYNRRTNAAFFVARELPENEARSLNVIATGGDGRVVAGLMGETQFAWLKVSIMESVSFLYLPRR